MTRTSCAVLRSVAAFSLKACNTSPSPLPPNFLCKAAAAAPSELASSFRFRSSRISRLRGALLCLESLQPLHAARAQATFVTRLSLGSQDPVLVLQGHFFSALTEL